MCNCSLYLLTNFLSLLYRMTTADTMNSSVYPSFSTASSAASVALLAGAGAAASPISSVTTPS